MSVPTAREVRKPASPPAASPAQTSSPTAICSTTTRKRAPCGTRPHDGDHPPQRLRRSGRILLLRDEREMGLIDSGGLHAGPHEVKLVIQDRMFDPGSRLAYPDAPAPSLTWPGGPSRRLDFCGEVITVNGRSWPYLRVEPRPSRFRLLNGSESRFLRAVDHTGHRGGGPEGGHRHRWRASGTPRAASRSTHPLPGGASRHRRRLHRPRWPDPDADQPGTSTVPARRSADPLHG